MQSLPRTKIVCTIGPGCDSVDTLTSMIGAGMSVARMNFSHGTHEEHRARIGAVQKAALQAGRPVGILADLQGPKIRIGELKDTAYPVVAGQSLRITTRKLVGDGKTVSTSYPAFVQDVSRGDIVLIDDGKLRFEVITKEDDTVDCVALNDGELKPHKGINLPGVALSTPSLTEKDRGDMAFALAEGVDFIAISFVRHPEDVRMAREAMGEKKVPLIAKIERPEALDHIEKIVEAADGIMVARGDLGIEIPLEDVPYQQKRMITLANDRGRFVITATQMLESMIHSPSPTRAEVTDISTAILDGSDAIMLSGETAVGRYPVKAVETMAKVAKAAEKMVEPVVMDELKNATRDGRVDRAIAISATVISELSDMVGIAAFTESGHTALMISKQKPMVPVFGLTSHPDCARRLTMYRGVIPVLIQRVDNTDQLFQLVGSRLKEIGGAKAGDQVAVTMGLPFGQTGTTNLLHVMEIK
ncbi:MAG: pyruvate kinase [Acidobacteria bacterium]|nr:pyruvate kinase [Acidobacteriota bacterium]